MPAGDAMIVASPVHVGVSVCARMCVCVHVHVHVCVCEFVCLWASSLHVCIWRRGEGGCVPLVSHFTCRAASPPQSLYSQMYSNVLDIPSTYFRYPQIEPPEKARALSQSHVPTRKTIGVLTQPQQGEWLRVCAYETHDCETTHLQAQQRARPPRPAPPSHIPPPARPPLPPSSCTPQRPCAPPPRGGRGP